MHFSKITVFAVLLLVIQSSCSDPKQKAIELKQEGINLLYESKFDEAIAKLEKSQSYNAADAETYYYLANAWYGKGDRKKSIEYLTQSIQTDSGYVEAYINRAKMYKEEGKRDEACSDFLKAETLGAKNVSEETKFCN